MPRLISLWRNLRGRGRIERELDEELRTTLDMLVAENMRSGMAHDDARRAARVELGSVESIKDHVRDARAGAFFEMVLQDVRYAARLLGRNPLFTLTAVLSLAVGIGATTAVFTVSNGLLLRSVPGLADPDRIVDIVRRERSNPGIRPVSYLHYLDVRRQATTLDGVYGYQLDLEPLSFRVSDSAERVFGNFVTMNYFEVLGVRASAGRFFGVSDNEQIGASPVIVLSHRFWTRRFEANSAIVGETVYLNRQPFLIAGVAPQVFQGTSILAPDLWIPAVMAAVVQPERGESRLSTRENGWLLLGARLKPRVSRAQASAEIKVIGAGLEREFPPAPAYTPLGRQPLADHDWNAEPSSPVPAGFRLFAATISMLLMGSVSLVLLIACINLAGILLARATVRRREIALRSAIGAGRGRIVQQMLTETVLLFLIGGTAGLILARVLTLLIVALLPAFPFPVALRVPLDVGVVAFSLGLSIVAALLSGLAPALQASRTDVVVALKDDSQGPADRLRLRSAFVVGQVAVSVLLVVTAGIFARGLDRVASQEPGFAADGVDLVSLDLSMAGYSDATGPRLAGELLNRVRAIAGVERASLADRAPGSGSGGCGSVSVPGVQPPNGLPFFHPSCMLVDPGYFDTLGIRLRKGRQFGPHDRAAAESVAIIGAGAARQYWPEQDPIGQYLLLRRGNPFAPNALPPIHLHVIGVAPDLTGFSGPGGRAQVELYLPFDQLYTPTVTILARTGGDRSVGAKLQAAVRATDANLPILDAQPLVTYQNNAIETQLRISAAVAASVGIVGLLLAAIGVYGVTAYTVTRRTREIGIRLSLGARRVAVVGLVLRQGMLLVAIGFVIGMMMATGAGVVLSRLSFGVAPPDALMFAITAAVFGAIGLAACVVPVHRAMNIRAMAALRYE